MKDITFYTSEGNIIFTYKVGDISHEVTVSRIGIQDGGNHVVRVDFNDGLNTLTKEISGFSYVSTF